jgi:eukaryotic-like serine/threonine-protein kinase
MGPGSAFDDRAGSRYLLVDQTDQPKNDPARDWKQQEKSVRERLPDYQRMRIEQVDYRSWPAADWEFTFGEHTHVLDRGFVTGNKGYAIYFSAPESQWQDSQVIFQTAADTFRPSR